MSEAKDAFYTMLFISKLLFIVLCLSFIILGFAAFRIYQLEKRIRKIQKIMSYQQQRYDDQQN